QAAHDLSHRHLFRPYRVAFHTQSQHLLYLATSGSAQGRLVFEGLSGKRKTLGAGGGTITDFSLSLDRSTAVYSFQPAGRNHPSQLWLLSLVDGSTQRVFSHPDWTVSQPHFSPDGT